MESSAELRPDRRAEAGLGGVRDVVRLTMAESAHAMSYQELEQDVRDRLDFRIYKRTSRQIQEATRQEHLMGAMECLAFRSNRWRLTPKGLEALEADKPAYRDKCAEAVRRLADVAVARVAERPGAMHTRIDIDTSFEPGLAVVESNPRGGLFRYDGTNLLRSEKDLLPDGHKAFGTLHLMARRLELHCSGDGHAEELLAFNYPKGDQDFGKRVHDGRVTPDMHTEIRRRRVSLGQLRQLIAELQGGRPA